MVSFFSSNVKLFKWFAIYNKSLNLEIVNSELYIEEEKNIAFNKAYKQIELAKSHEVRNLSGIITDMKRFRNLCKKHGKEFNFEGKGEEHPNKSVTMEKEFIENIKKLTDEHHIREAYRELKDYKGGVVLSQFESWVILLEKTSSIKGNIQLFIEYLEESNYPGANFRTNNSRYLHYGLAAALKNINTRQEILEYLYESSGHAGFVNVNKAYEVINDKDTCLLLFNCYLKFCNLLIS